MRHLKLVLDITFNQEFSRYKNRMSGDNHHHKWNAAVDLIILLKLLGLEAHVSND